MNYKRLYRIHRQFQISVGLLLCGFLMLLSGCSQSVKDTAKPNIVLIQVDDLGYDDLSLHGNPDIETPNIDELGNESVRFQSFYLSALCAPSRASLLTGRNFLRTGVSGVHAGRDYINLDETLLSEVLQENGYKTGMWGKWHSGKTNGYFPWDRGFDEAYYASLYNYFDNEGLLNGKPIETKGFTTDAITDMAINFIEKNKDSTFFAYMSHLAPHNPWRAPQSYIDKYLTKGLSKPMATLYGMIDNLDWNIGRLVSKIDSLGLGENTVVVFMSDNGPWVRSYRFGLNDEEWKRRNPSGMRGKKGSNWENGIRSPLFFRWKGKFQAVEVDETVKMEDIFPSLLQLAGVSVPTELSLDGTSFASVFNGEKIAERTVHISYPTPVGDTIYKNELDKYGNSIPLTEDFKASFAYENQRLAIRKGDFKYFVNEQSERKALFNIEEDYRESKTTSNASISEELNNELRTWYGEILNSKHAYQMPEFQIGYRERKFNQIYACAPSWISKNLMNKDHFLANWTQVGDSATYKINVRTPGKYKAFIVHKMKNYQNCGFTVSVGNAACSSQLKDSGSRDFGTLLENESAYWENFDLKETFKKDIIKSEIGTLNLETGRSELTLSLTELPENHVGDMMDQVIALHLIRN